MYAARRLNSHEGEGPCPSGTDTVFLMIECCFCNQQVSKSHKEIKADPTIACGCGALLHVCARPEAVAVPRISTEAAPLTGENDNS